MGNWTPCSIAYRSQHQSNHQRSALLVQFAFSSLPPDQGAPLWSYWVIEYMNKYHRSPLLDLFAFYVLTPHKGAPLQSYWYEQIYTDLIFFIDCNFVSETGNISSDFANNVLNAFESWTRIAFLWLKLKDTLPNLSKLATNIISSSCWIIQAHLLQPDISPVQFGLQLMCHQS